MIRDEHWKRGWNLISVRSSMRLILSVDIGTHLAAKNKKKNAQHHTKYDERPTQFFVRIINATVDANSLMWTRKERRRFTSNISLKKCDDYYFERANLNWKWIISNDKDSWPFWIIQRPFIWLRSLKRRSSIGICECIGIEIVPPDWHWTQHRPLRIINNPWMATM